MISNASSQLESAVRLTPKRSMVYDPSDDWTYSHHPSLARFQGRFYVIWSNGRRDEDSMDQRVLIASSNDFIYWSAPTVLFEMPGQVLTAAGFHQNEGALVAYVAKYSPDYTETQLFASSTADGESWSDFHDLDVPVCLNQAPFSLSSGRLLAAGNFVFPYSDNPSGMSEWRLSKFGEGSSFEDNPNLFGPVSRLLGLPGLLCEGSPIELSPGRLLMVLRCTGEGHDGRLWASESRDDGETWTDPQVTDFSDNDSKFQFGKLPDGRFFYLGNPSAENRGHRCPLVISTSDDGLIFDSHFILADEPRTLGRPGKWKHGEYGYPQAIVADGHFYAVASRQKEAVEAFCVPLDQLQRAAGH